MLACSGAMTGGGDGGIWGHWTSRDSLPAFVYTADQDAVPAAAVPPNAPYGKPEMKDPAARGDREHSFQIGNDRLVLVGSNYGTWRLRADEGGPKFLNDADVDNSTGWRFGGGLGYLFAPLDPVAAPNGAPNGALNGTAAPLLTSAYVPAGRSSLQGRAPARCNNPREFGVGYGSVTASASVGASVGASAGAWVGASAGASAGASVGADVLALRHTVAVLPGDDPAVLI